MTALILDWKGRTGEPARGVVSLACETWRRDADALAVPWAVTVEVAGPTVVDVSGAAGQVLTIRWHPEGSLTSLVDHVLVPDDGEHLAHLLPRVDPATLAPDTGPDMAAWEAALAAQVDALRAELAAVVRPVSNLTVDESGTPVWEAGASTHTLTIDPDGTPVVVPA